MYHSASDNAPDNSKYRFDVISTISGRQEPYIGVFDTRRVAENWFATYGQWHLRRGRPLILVRCPSAKSSEEEFEDCYIEDN
jgi:hypothetical protein